MNAKKFFDKPKKGVLAPPPYTVQVECITRDPSRIDQINNLYMEAFTMAAQMQQYFPLSALFRLLNIEGKDRLLPVIEANEQQQATMQQMQQQIEQMTAQMQQLQQENQSLKLTSTDLTNALASAGVSANQQQATAARMPQAGMQQNTRQALIDNSRAELMRPEIEE
jgi:regulator of replication initiation timing